MKAQARRGLQAWLHLPTNVTGSPYRSVPAVAPLAEALAFRPLVPALLLSAILANLLGRARSHGQSVHAQTL